MRAAALAAAGGAEAHVVDNTMPWGVSVPVCDGRVEFKLAVGDRTLTADRIESIVLVSLHAKAPPELSDDDAAYAEQESLAAWLAFTADLPCRVVNRPRSALFPLVSAAPVYQRALARELGIPTAPEMICDGAELARLRRRGLDAACVDLSTQRTFWLRDAHPREPNRLYSVVRISREAGYCIAAAAGQRRVTFRWTPGTTAVRSREPAVADPTSTILGALGIEYGYCVFARGTGGLVFTRLSTLSPATLGPNSIRLLAGELHQISAA